MVKENQDKFLIRTEYVKYVKHWDVITIVGEAGQQQKWKE